MGELVPLELGERDLEVVAKPVERPRVCVGEQAREQPPAEVCVATLVGGSGSAITAGAAPSSISSRESGSGLVLGSDRQPGLASNAAQQEIRAVAAKAS
ncbi:hypothetical protein [Enhygromyxa salina]|uniref:Uncharacterized protein n=1 Tax=Enhygromyxa salina TaxID=215803 RepID=A0A2S9YX94_9BACT|nr:hypothetical protein [Enhygromyxa salina]PRQ09679.1 hypothetical protein ENSA7_05950 [Enhygromyxa salina]